MIVRLNERKLPVYFVGILRHIKVNDDDIITSSSFHQQENATKEVSAIIIRNIPHLFICVL